MDMFYIVTEQCCLHHQYFSHLVFEKNAQELFSQLKKEFSIAATKYVPRPNRLSIVATSTDNKNFAGQLMKSDADGLRPFKIKSAVNMAWVKKFNDAGLKYVRIPSPSWELGILAAGQYSLFDYEDKLYMSLSFPDSDLTDFAGCTPISGSDFYKVVEAVQSMQSRKC